MTAFPETAQRVSDRIQSAPVEDWLKQEALADLRRLTDAHITAIREYEAKFEVKASAEHEHPSPIDETFLRQTALEIASKHGGLNRDQMLDHARNVLAFLKGDR